MNKPFRFKQFIIKQDRCAMKVGTDGVLLGAWTSITHDPFSILDIGAGTGLISLMLAQRSQAPMIEALEIDDQAYEQCVDNFEHSKWNDRLFCFHASLLEFASEIEDTFDLIVCNPPFYSESYKAKDESRAMARFQDAMPFPQLLESVSLLLSTKGTFSVIIPFTEEPSFIDLASNYNLFPRRITRVKGNPSSEVKRSLIEFSFNKFKPEVSELIIETQRHLYTDNYKNLTQDFYLKM